MIGDFNQLRCFITLAEELHFGRAAARLFMTQPPLSRQIQLLEEALGVRLFERNSRMVRLTEAGEDFLASAINMLAMAEQSVKKAQKIQSGCAGHVTLGFTAVSGYSLLPHIINQANIHLPDIEITLKEMISAKQVAELSAGTISLALMRPTIMSKSYLSHRRFHREPVVLAMPRDHALSACEKITLSDLRHQSFISYSPDDGRYFYELTLDLLADINPPPKFIQYLGQTHSILALVNAGMGIALVPTSAKNIGFSNVCFRPLWPSSRHSEVWLSWRNDQQTAAERTMRDFILSLKSE
ncbi:LysR family transcriptional regulator [Candidatus Pantoea multigeneris]|uniref:LysR family transcriptional regulator n=1 Tax=Candidatus Pantoea multigeneris TaxID=2608357 RepID=A0ABX0RAT2_9GAMM|nr:LysR family transcriptional regulator [Pantoea multigeneris]NIF20350.1 LysR family transcriptional regulator [Pantoea multigeneris]